VAPVRDRAGRLGHHHGPGHRHVRRQRRLHLHRHGTLTATATPSDANGDPVTLTYVWKVNGTPVKPTTTPATTDTLNLSQSGKAAKGQTITVEVTPADPTLTGAVATAKATVADSAPVVDSAVITPNSPLEHPTTSDTLTVTVTSHDPDGDSVTNSFRW